MIRERTSIPGGGPAVVMAVALLLGVAPGLGSARAQEATLEQQAPKATPLVLQKDPALASGQVAVVEGTADPAGRRFRLGNLSVLQPVMAAVLAQDDETDLQLAMLKPGDEAPRLSASTRGQGHAILETRTQGGLDFLVTGPEGSAPFALVVWVSDEVTPPLADVVVSPADYRGSAAAPAEDTSGSTRPGDPSGAPGESGMSKVLLILLAFVAGGAVFALGMLLKGRRHG